MIWPVILPAMALAIMWENRPGEKNFSLRARGLIDSLSFWVVSDIFEECRVGDIPFHGGFGLINVQGLKKPSFHGHWFLSRLGNEVLAEGDGYALIRWHRRINRHTPLELLPL